MANKLLTGQEVSQRMFDIAKEIQKEYNLTDEEMISVITQVFEPMMNGPMKMGYLFD